MNTAESNKANLVTVPLYRLAHGRTGDKGNISNISVVAWSDEFFPIIERQLTEEAVARWFVDRRPLRVTRYVLPSIGAMNFVIEGILDGGVNDALNLDSHGKALSFFLLDFPIQVEPEISATLPDIP